MDAQRRNALIFITQGVGCASCMCGWGISKALFNGNVNPRIQLVLESALYIEI